MSVTLTNCRYAYYYFDKLERSRNKDNQCQVPVVKQENTLSRVRFRKGVFHASYFSKQRHRRAVVRLSWLSTISKFSSAAAHFAVVGCSVGCSSNPLEFTRTQERENFLKISLTNLILIFRINKKLCVKF